MEISQLETLLRSMWAAPTRNTALYLQGPPGIGKTAVCEEVAASLGLNLLNFALPSCEAVDLRGLPYIQEGRTHWACPLPREGRGVLLLDEVASAQQDVQVAAHHIVHSQKGSDVGIGEGWHVVLTGNRAQDRTYYRALGAPLRNRMIMVSVESSGHGWCEWAKTHGISPLVTGFIRWRPELLHAREIPPEGAFPSPRSYETVSNLLTLETTQAVETELIEGAIGQGASVEFSAYLRTARELPQIHTIENDPEKTPVPSSPSLLYALITSLAHYTRQSRVSLMKYVSRCPAEFALLYIKDIRDKFDLRSDPDIKIWIGKHTKLFQESENE